jgi:hypothetical protein
MLSGETSNLAGDWLAADIETNVLWNILQDLCLSYALYKKMCPPEVYFKMTLKLIHTRLRFTWLLSHMIDFENIKSDY